MAGLLASVSNRYHQGNFTVMLQTNQNLDQVRIYNEQFIYRDKADKKCVSLALETEIAMLGISTNLVTPISPCFA